MADKPDIKQQRDRFLAFSFASADLFLEIDESNIVRFALGAAQSLTGIDHNTLLGRDWFEFFSSQDLKALKNIRKTVEVGRRCGPFAVTMNEDIGNGQQAILTAIKMPGTESLYVTLGFPNKLMEGLAALLAGQNEINLVDKDSFLYSAQDALINAGSFGENLVMTLLDIERTETIKEDIGPENWGGFTQTVEEVLGTYAYDGQTVACISEGRYSFIHDGTVNSEDLKEEISALSKESDPAGKGFEISSKNVAADIESLSERETMKALVYTINEFERKGTNLDIDALKTGFRTFVSANAQKIQDFKQMIDQVAFDFSFQPIIDLETDNVAHFEMLSRFHKGGSTREWVYFAEDIGMAADFDIAVCDKAINHLLYKFGGMPTKFSVNISGASIQNEQFFKTLMAKLTLNENLSNRLIFEITESSAIVELEMVNFFIENLQQKGFQVCLDDFGAANSASFQHLQKLHVDLVKIEGQYTQKYFESERDALLVKNICKMCKDLGITTIAERIENEEQARAFADIGVTLGQGYYFGAPEKRPEYKKK